MMGKIWFVLVIFLSIALPPALCAQIPTATPVIDSTPTPPAYYVDGVNGDDSYNGISPIWTAGSDGPWETIGRAVTELDPGDVCWGGDLSGI